MTETTESDIPNPEDMPKPYVVYLKLQSGDEIVGLCMGETEDHQLVALRAPMLMSEIPNPFTQATSIALSKYMPLGDFDVLPVQRKDIIFIVPAIPEMVEFYHGSVIYTRDFVDSHMRAELKLSTQAVYKAILQEQEQAEGVLKIPGKNLIIPPNTALH